MRLSFGEYLQEACGRSQVQFPTAAVYDGPLLTPLRDLRTKLKLPVWAELTVGSSLRGYLGLGAYIRVFGSNIISPAMEAWYVLNTEDPPLQRYHRIPDQWWRCDCWMSMGQVECIAETTLEYTMGMRVHTASQYAAALRRYHHAMRLLQQRPRL